MNQYTSLKDFVNSDKLRLTEFELGGNSLQALRLQAQLEKNFNKTYTLATLFQAPTIKKLADLLSQEDGEQKPQLSLVEIQTQGSKPPLFCVDGGGFNVTINHHLSDHLGCDQPVYGLQARGVDGILKVHSRVEEMATDYIDEIREIQPQGPYYFIGLSNGGKIALEMAQQLHQQGETVAFLGMIDTPGLNYPKLLAPIPRLFSILNYVRKYTVPRTINKLKKEGFGSALKKGKKAKHSSKQNSQSVKASQTNPQELAKQLGFRNIVDDENTRYQQNLLDQWIHRLNVYVIKKSSLAFYNVKAEVLGIQSSTTEAIQKLEEVHDKAHSRYTPTSYFGRITIFRATEQPPGFEHDSNLGWDQIATQGVENYDIQGYHHSIIRSPLLAERLRACLNQLQA